MRGRITGYYWVLFKRWPVHGRPETHWEIASWDAAAQSWVMFGSGAEIPLQREREVFLEIDERPIVRDGERTGPSAAA